LRSKYAALALLALVSFAGPFLETAITGGVESMGKWEIGETLVALALVFWWYHLDKAENGYRAGPLMNGGMLLVMAIAMPIYLVRSRGWKRGLLATALAAACAAVSFGLGELGEVASAWLSRVLLVEQLGDVHVHEARPGGKGGPYGDLNTTARKVDLARLGARPVAGGVAPKAPDEVLHR